MYINSGSLYTIHVCCVVYHFHFLQMKLKMCWAHRPIRTYTHTDCVTKNYANIFNWLVSHTNHSVYFCFQFAPISIQINSQCDTNRFKLNQCILMSKGERDKYEQTITTWRFQLNRRPEYNYQF